MRIFPNTRAIVREKIRSLRTWQSGEGFLEKARETLSDLGRELTEPAAKSDPHAPPITQQQPRSTAPVAEGPPPASAEVPQKPLTLEALIDLAVPVLKPLADVGLVVLFTIFILLQREDLRNRLILLAGAGDLNRATVAMSDAASRLSRFFLLQAALNGSFGLFVALALWGLDVPAALGFGVLATLMRFVPYIGSVLAALPPIAIAAAMEPGWSTALLVAAVFGIGEPLMGQVIEPLVFGRHTGLSPIAVVGAATFWTWLWGPIGLILSTPLTLCLVVLGQYTRALGFLTVLLSDEPALTPPEAFYQRLLAGDAAELVWLTETALKSRSLVGYYDDVVMPGLRLAHLDGRAGQLDEERLQDVASALDDLVETLGEAELGLDKDDSAADDLRGGDAENAAWKGLLAEISPRGIDAVWRREQAVVIRPGRGILDFAAARMVADLLQKIGFGVEVSSRDGALAKVDQKAAPLIEVVASAGGLTLKELRYGARRIERMRPHVTVLCCAFGMDVRDDFKGDRLILSIAELLTVMLRRAHGPPNLEERGDAGSLTPEPTQSGSRSTA